MSQSPLAEDLTLPNDSFALKEVGETLASAYKFIKIVSGSMRRPIKACGINSYSELVDKINGCFPLHQLLSLETMEQTIVADDEGLLFVLEYEKTDSDILELKAVFQSKKRSRSGSEDSSSEDDENDMDVDIVEKFAKWETSETLMFRDAAKRYCHSEAKWAKIAKKIPNKNRHQVRKFACSQRGKNLLPTESLSQSLYLGQSLKVLDNIVSGLRAPESK